MVNNKIGCQAGKTKIVDPNNFGGGSSSSNLSVPLEDLNISVKLSTNRRGRTVFTNDGENNLNSRTTQSSNNVTINFIEGSEINGTKTLTTKYTDLTTVFEEGTINNETLGITNIDIDFSSSYAPMITISFIDVRGSSIFQNEQLISGDNTKNKYSTFFQMPYPLFELEIKGYYGKPVTYCLHMLKFSSKFNSKTGNFEITCNFIGYTYAMLSDMLVGYLRAITETTIGKEKFNAYNDKREAKGLSRIYSLNDLTLKISKINEGFKKIPSDSEAASILEASNNGLQLLKNVEELIRNLGVELDAQPKINDITRNRFPFIVKIANTTTQQQNVLNDYKKNIENVLTEFKKLNLGDNLKISDFKDIDVKGPDKGFYIGLTKASFDPSKSQTTNQQILKEKLNSPNNFEELKVQIFEYLNKNYSIGDNKTINIYNLNLLYKELDKTKSKIEKDIKDNNKQLALELKDSVRDTLGFEPTVRNIIQIFTTAIEVFMETIFEVSKAAEDETNTERNEELKKAFGTNVISSDMTQEKLRTEKYYAWPDYREKVASISTYVDKYLGEQGVLESPEKVNELVFINDLLEAFIKSSKISDEAKANLDAQKLTWYPVNPLDSVLFNSTEPYERQQMLSQSDILRLMLIRGMIALGYSNDSSLLSNEEIQAMAVNEANLILRNVKDEALVSSLKYLTLDNVKNVKGVINDKETSVILEDNENNEYFYRYIYPDKNLRVLPISGKFTNTNWGTGTDTDLINIAEDNNLFLTNYSTSFNSAINKKPNDGGVYVKILTPEEFKTDFQLYPLPDVNGVNNNNVLRLQSIKDETLDTNKVKEAGFNVFGGTYGAQDFNTIIFDEDGIGEAPLLLLFYSNHRNGLAYTRSESLTKNDKIVKNYSYSSNKNILNFSSTRINDLQRISKGGVLLHKFNGKNRNLLLENKEKLSYPYIFQPLNEFPVGNNDEYNLNFKDGENTLGFSIFGSEFYYYQDETTILVDGSPFNISKYSKALLFLNTLPFVSLGINVDFDTYTEPDPINYITHLFDIRSGFIHAPRLWCAYIGGMLWRLSTDEPKIDENNNIFSGGSTNKDIITWKYSNSLTLTGNQPPTKDEYFPIIIFENKAKFYPDITDNDFLKRLPEQVKDEFKKIFFDFVNGTDGKTSWDTLRSELEIWDGTSTEFSQLLSSINTNSNVNLSQLAPLKNKDKYEVIYPLKNSFWLELKDGYGTNTAVTTLIDSMLEEVIIMNNGYNIWRPNKGSITRHHINVNKDIFDLYFGSLINKLIEETNNSEPDKIKKQYEQEIFGSSDENLIKLQLYRTCKNIHDKWLAGTQGDNILFQCGKRNAVDSELTQKTNDENTNTSSDLPKLIDSFRFVSRSFRDIGDELYINPLPVKDFLIDNQNSSSYDVISSILNNNNFEFIALPTFINFKDDSELESVFKPFGNYGEAISVASCGPSFVCAYIGQTSKHLDFVNSDYPNDGFDLRCIDGDVDPNVPDDFKINSEEYEDPVATFVVKYSQQNQNLFKDITLDQSEFTETDESLQIQEDISQKGSESNRTIGGQNIYNVHAVRSYSAEVEMMGNAMIQPMMYFQLDNIPMFHGAYMITRVKHNIKPNHMSTSFTGVRIRSSQTKLINALDLYMSFIDTLDLSNAKPVTEGSSGGGNGTIPNSSPPILQTLIDNGVTSGNIDSGNIKPCKVNKIKGISFVLDAVPIMICEAVKPFEEMMTEWVKWMKNNNFKGVNNEGKTYAYVTSMFRSNSKNSMHSFGLAVDLQFFNKEGVIFGNNKKNAKTGIPFNFTSNPAIKWLYQNSYKYGFVQPFWANDGTGEVNSKSADEHWHWEYHGKSAICMLRKRPIPGLGNNKATDNPLSSIKEENIIATVVNPKGVDGKEAVYTNCNHKTTLASDKFNDIQPDVKNDSNYWALLSICALEASLPQARADVAQAIYNRFNTPKKPYGKTIKEIITAKGQFEPTFKNKNDWENIKDESTAITAIVNSKGWTKDKAKIELYETNVALKDKTLQQNSIVFIGTRTEFLAYYPKSNDADSVVHRTTPSNSTANGGNNYFYWQYAGKSLKDKTPPNEPPIVLV